MLSKLYIDSEQQCHNIRTKRMKTIPYSINGTLKLGWSISCPPCPPYFTITDFNLERGSNEHFVRFVALINSIRKMQGQMATKQGNVPTSSLSDAPKTGTDVVDGRPVSYKLQPRH